MKLLFDQNLSFRLVKAMQVEYPDSQHVRNVGLGDASDEVVWRYAAEHEYTVVTKDADFHQRSFLFGAPPKVVWLRCGNASTQLIETLLRRHYEDLLRFSADEEGSFLVIE